MRKPASVSSIAVREVEQRLDHLCSGPRCGKLLHVDDEGRAIVDFPDNPGPPVAARLALSALDIGELMKSPEQADVLLLFEANDLTRPLIVGVIRDRVPAGGAEITVRGKRLTLEANEDVQLQCGSARLRMTREGRVVVLGDEVVTRARRSNRIRGGTVHIN
jgi:hypothetical protein